MWASPSHGRKHCIVSVYAIHWNTSTTSSHLCPQIRGNHWKHTAVGFSVPSLYMLCFPVFSLVFSVDPDGFLQQWLGVHQNVPSVSVSASNSSSSSWCSASFQVKVSEKRQHLKITWHILTSYQEYIDIISTISWDKPLRRMDWGESPGTNNIDSWELSVRLCVPLAACCHFPLSYTVQHCLYTCWNLQVLIISPY